MIIRRNPSIIKLALIIIISIGAVFYGKETSKGIENGIYFCAEVLVPSIFPFMVISAIVSNSSINFLNKKFNKLSNKLFGFSSKALSAVILGIFGGYPVGARGIASLYENGSISKQEAEKASYIAVGAGPGFLINFVGTRLFNSGEAGAILLISQVLSVIFLGVLNKLIFKNKNNYNSNSEIYTVENRSDIFVRSVSSAVYGIIEMCAMVCIFSAVLETIQSYFGNNIYVSILLEVTTACSSLSKSGNLILTAFAVGFGGICVHFQIFQAVNKINIKKGVFFLYRIIQGFFTAGITYLLVKIFNITIPVFSSTAAGISLTLSTSLIGSLLLIITGICFLYSIKN